MNDLFANVNRWFKTSMLTLYIDENYTKYATSDKVYVNRNIWCENIQEDKIC